MDYGKYCYNIIIEIEARLKSLERELAEIKSRLSALEDYGE